MRRLVAGSESSLLKSFEFRSSCECRVRWNSISVNVLARWAKHIPVSLRKSIVFRAHSAAAPIPTSSLPAFGYQTAIGFVT